MNLKAVKWLEEQFDVLWSRYGHVHEFDDGTVQFTVAGQRSQGLFISFKVTASTNKGATRRYCEICGNEVYNVEEWSNHASSHERERIYFRQKYV